MMIIKILLSIALLIVAYFFLLSFLTRHDILKTVSERQLSPCPNKPNCVLSTSTIKHEAINPLALLDNNPQLSWQAFTRAVQQNGGDIIVHDERYLHAVFTSTLFRFKDDLEAQLSDKHIDIRSASRAGKSDLGQNRKRIERIRSSYLQ